MSTNEKTTNEKVPATKPMDTQPSHEDMDRMRREDPLFLEKTRPEDPSGRAGQLTRDNVTPHIPSGERGAPPGPIVDPASLGMEQGGVAPTNPMKPENPIGARFEDARYDRLNEVGERKGQIEQKYHDDLAKLNKEENDKQRRASK